MTFRLKLLLYLALALATAIFGWPAGALLLFFFADINGDVPTIRPEKEGGV